MSERGWQPVCEVYPVDGECPAGSLVWMPYDLGWWDWFVSSPTEVAQLGGGILGFIVLVWVVKVLTERD